MSDDRSAPPPEPGRAARVTAPTRIDLAGGTLDVWPLCQLIPDVRTVHVALDLRAEAVVEPRASGYEFRALDLNRTERCEALPPVATREGLRLHHELARALDAPNGLLISTRSRVPRGSGLGGSSSLAVAALVAGDRALRRDTDAASVVRRAANLEARVIRAPTGTQDHLAAFGGGVGVVGFDSDGPWRDRLDLPLDQLERRLVLVYSGLPHDSALNNWAVTRAYLDGEARVRDALHEIAAVSRELAGVLARGVLDAVGPLVAAEWAARRRLAPGVTTPTIERLGRAATAAGAEAFKACGAGGGGAVVFWCPPDRRAAVEASLRELDAQLLPSKLAELGVA